MNKEAKITSLDFKKQFKKKKWYKKWWVIVLIILGLYLLVITLLTIIIGDKVLNSDSQDIISLNSSEQVAPEDLWRNTEDDPSWGEKTAPVQIVEFSDFECPFCRESFFVIREALFKYQDKIFFVYRDFPNFEDHPHAQKAAQAANCANEQGKFWPLHDKLFINQESLDDEFIKRYAKEVGIDQVKFNACFSSGKYIEEMKQDYEDGVTLGVIGTPTFFINGYKIAGAIPRETFFQIIELALK
ncbi:DsbA family protein [Patescibacteria group bacterium]|nr:DsbA family protein [Patescibacteria group bacterium]